MRAEPVRACSTGRCRDLARDRAAGAFTAPELRNKADSDPEPLLRHFSILHACNSRPDAGLLELVVSKVPKQVTVST